MLIAWKRRLAVINDVTYCVPEHRVSSFPDDPEQVTIGEKETSPALTISEDSL